jgi:hypothetical protein
MIELLLASALAVHDTQILNCSGIRRSIKVDERMLGNGLLREGYDTNQDGKVDVVALSSMTGMAPANGGPVPHQEFPTFYIVDLNHDGFSDHVYVDVSGDGACESLRLYEDLNAKPSDMRPGQVGGAL